MKYLIKNCKVIHRSSKLHRKKVDILIDKGEILNIGSKLSDPKAKIIEGKQLHASIGWMDIGTHMGEPGYEHRETFESLSNAAKHGGYTDLVSMPQSIPIIQTKAQIKNIISAGQAYGIDIHPLGALSQNSEGENISELIDMHNAGAVGFTDGLKTVEKSGLLLRALQYVKMFSGVILHHPSDRSLSNDNLIHEGNISTSLGMKGSPSLAENLMIYRDLKLQEYAESRLCIHLISTKESVDLIKIAKKNDDKVVSGVSYLNLIKSHEDLSNFDSNLKVKPLLRDKKDQKALRRGLAADSLDYISSNHYPLEVEKKHLEYPYASHGAIGLETCFAAMNTSATKELDLETIIHKISIGPRETLELDIPEIKIGSKAKITVFDPSIKWTYQERNVQSLSNNSPFLNNEFEGKVVATINGTNVFQP